LLNNIRTRPEIRAKEENSVKFKIKLTHYIF